MMVGSA